MKTAIVIGGTGLVGKQLTYLLIGDRRYSKVVLLVRKPLGIIHEKLEQVVFDFDNPDESLINGDELFCCLGTTKANAGSKAAFYKVDHDYVLNTATTAFKNGIKKIALVSSAGANKDSAFFYQKTKGEIEEKISKIGFEGCFILRPSILVGSRTEFRAGESFAVSFMNAFSFMFPAKYKPVPGLKVAKAMIDFINSGKTGVTVIESIAIAATMG